MPLFRPEGRLGRPARARRQQQARSAAIEAFWAWWQVQGARATDAALTAGHPEWVESELSRAVDEISPDLAWHLATGEHGRHLLLLSSERDPTLRAVVRRWLLAAPTADTNWEYADTRRPAADPAGVVLRLDGADLDIARASAHARVHGAALDVTVYHPEFIGLPDPSRSLATHLMLETVLGEAAMETWLAAIGSSEIPPLDPVPLTGLRHVVGELRSRFTRDDGNLVWVTLEGTAPNGRPVLAASQVPLRPATAPHLDTYLGLAVPFAELTPDGQPTGAAVTALDELGEQLAETLAGNGRSVAHETANGVRVLHLYVDSATSAADLVRVIAAGWDQGLIGLDLRPDPDWEAVRHLTI